MIVIVFNLPESFICSSAISRLGIVSEASLGEQSPVVTPTRGGGDTDDTGCGDTVTRGVGDTRAQPKGLTAA